MAANKRKPKLIAIVGPTASGKSELAVKLAKKFSGEIISADSRQVYRELDIGTGKVVGRWIKLKAPRPSRGEAGGEQKSTLVPSLGRKKLKTETQNLKVFAYKSVIHHCIDFVPPSKSFSAAEFKKCAEAAIQDIADQGKLPILVGGTGFWIDTVAHNLNIPTVPPNPNLRKKLTTKTAAELVAILKKLDPARAKTVEPKNPRRLIRAIEIARALGFVPKLKKRKAYNVLWLGLKSPQQTLHRNIKRRVRKMLDCGLAAETKKLLHHRLTKKRISELGFEYRSALLFLEKKVSRRHLEKALVRDTLKYARRQAVWFKRNRAIHWLATKKEADELLQKFLAAKLNP